MEKTLDAKKQDKVEALAEDAKESASEGYNTENQLSNNLISVTLAFVALLATAISTSNVLLMIGLVLCVAFIGTMLFETSRVVR